ncbi:hypothetical protein ACFQ3Z_02840 [Streptomyces nogalater]
MDGDRAEATANQVVYFYRDGEPPHRTSGLRVACTTVRTAGGLADRRHAHHARLDARAVTWCVGSGGSTRLATKKPRAPSYFPGGRSSYRM